MRPKTYACASGPSDDLTGHYCRKMESEEVYAEEDYELDEGMLLFPQNPLSLWD